MFNIMSQLILPSLLIVIATSSSQAVAGITAGGLGLHVTYSHHGVHRVYGHRNRHLSHGRHLGHFRGGHGNRHSNRYTGRSSDYCRGTYKHVYNAASQSTKINGTLCTDQYGQSYIVPGSRYVDEGYQ